MPIDTNPGGAAEAAIVAAITNGLLTVYAASGPDPVEMNKLARAIAPGVLVALQHIKDNADVTGVTAGTDTVHGGVE